MDTVIRGLIFLVGAGIILVTVFSAVKTFVLPRGAPDQITRWVFLFVQNVLSLRLKKTSSYLDRDRVMAFFAPFSLLTLLFTWLALILIGFTFMYWAMGGLTWGTAFRLSGSSLLTLGFAIDEHMLHNFFVFIEAALGLTIVALLIAYLPTIYSAYSRRETAVTLLEVRAGSPPSAIEMIKRFHRIHGLENLTEQWRSWEEWFADIQESHTSLAALVFFRSQSSNHSWVTAAGTVLDAASLTLSSLDVPYDPQAALCIRAGYLALNHIADYFGAPYPRDPRFPEIPIRISREEFDQACQELASKGVPLVKDLNSAWVNFAGWRVNYDFALLALAGLTMAPSALWSGDRPIKLEQKLFATQKLKTN